MASTKKVSPVSKEAKMLLVKMFRILGTGAKEGERLVGKLGIEPDAVQQLADHIDATVKIVMAVKNAMEMHMVAAAILDRVNAVRDKPPVRAPIGRPKSSVALRLIKGGE